VRCHSSRTRERRPRRGFLLACTKVEEAFGDCRNRQFVTAEQGVAALPQGLCSEIHHWSGMTVMNSLSPVAETFNRPEGPLGRSRGPIHFERKLTRCTNLQGGSLLERKIELAEQPVLWGNL
jgi:hypothetical protein